MCIILKETVRPIIRNDARTSLIGNFHCGKWEFLKWLGFPWIYLFNKNLSHCRKIIYSPKCQRVKLLANSYALHCPHKPCIFSQVTNSLLCVSVLVALLAHVSQLVPSLSYCWKPPGQSHFCECSMTLPHLLEYVLSYSHLGYLSALIRAVELDIP